MLAMFAAALSAPNATFIKSGIGDVSPIIFNLWRFGLFGLVGSPYIIRSINKLNSRNLKYNFVAGLSLAVAVVSYVMALERAQASYVTILTLLTPIIFVIYSVRLTKDKINHQSIAGITLAALGAFIMVYFPIASQHQAAFSFDSLAILLVLINVFTFPLAIVYSKKANLAGLPLTSVMSISAWIVAGLCLILSWLIHIPLTTDLPVKTWSVIIYSGLIVAFVARMMIIAGYERIGSAASSVVMYFESMLGILLPIMILGERLSMEMVIGGALILFGIWFVESHRQKHHHHFRLPGHN